MNSAINQDRLDQVLREDESIQVIKHSCQRCEACFIVSLLVCSVPTRMILTHPLTHPAHVPALLERNHTMPGLNRRGLWALCRGSVCECWAGDSSPVSVIKAEGMRGLWTLPSCNPQAGVERPSRAEGTAYRSRCLAAGSTAWSDIASFPSTGLSQQRNSICSHYCRLTDRCIQIKQCGRRFCKWCKFLTEIYKDACGRQYFDPFISWNLHLCFRYSEYLIM